jgi:hypothetical protein
LSANGANGRECRTPELANARTVSSDELPNALRSTQARTSISPWAGRRPAGTSWLFSSTIPSFRTTDEVQDFWDKHSVTEFEDKLREVPVSVSLESTKHLVAIEPSLIARVRRIA